MSSEHYFKSLYRVLVEAEDLLSGTPARSSESADWAELSYEERFAVFLDRFDPVRDKLPQQPFPTGGPVTAGEPVLAHSRFPKRRGERALTSWQPKSERVNGAPFLLVG